MSPVKIGFVLLSNSGVPAPSTRIAVRNMLPFLKAAGFEPSVVFEPAPGVGAEKPVLTGLVQKILDAGIRIVLFQKVRGTSVLETIHALRAAGVKTVYQVCDHVDAEMAAATDLTTTTTDFLKTLFPSGMHGRIHVVHDGIEQPEQVKTTWSEHQGSRQRPLRAVLVTSHGLTDLPVLGTLPKWLEVRIVGRYSPGGLSLRRINENRWRLSQCGSTAKKAAYLRFLANRRIRCVGWHPDGVYEEMKAADIGIIPVDAPADAAPDLALPPFWKVKSENRLTLKMCVGLPVIATPIPAYEPVVQQGQNAFLAHSRAEWLEYLELLRDPDIRKDMGEQARASVLERYSMQEQGRRLVCALQSLLGA